VSELSAQARWVLQPLTDAGLAHEEIEHLVVRLAFDSVVRSERLAPSSLGALVADQPVVVRQAWVEVLDRMIGGPLP
jgi:hypothetical protein